MACFKLCVARFHRYNKLSLRGIIGWPSEHTIYSAHYGEKSLKSYSSYYSYAVSLPRPYFMPTPIPFIKPICQCRFYLDMMMRVVRGD